MLKGVLYLCIIIGIAAGLIAGLLVGAYLLPQCRIHPTIITDDHFVCNIYRVGILDGAEEMEKLMRYRFRETHTRIEIDSAIDATLLFIDADDSTILKRIERYR